MMELVVIFTESHRTVNSNFAQGNNVESVSLHLCSLGKNTAFVYTYVYSTLHHISHRNQIFFVLIFFYSSSAFAVTVSCIRD